VHVTWDLIMPQMVTDRRGFNTRYSQQWYKYRNCKSVGLIEKVKVTLVQSLRLCTGRTAHRRSRGIALLFHNYDTRRREGSASRPGRSLSPEKIRYPLYRRLGGPQGRCGQVQRISPPAGIRSLDRPARSQSIYGLSYPARVQLAVFINTKFIQRITVIYIKLQYTC